MPQSPTVRQFMTACPFTLDAAQSVAMAGALMRQHNIRHLPVVRDGGLTGLLSDRDVALVFSLVDVDPGRVRAGDVMAREPYCVAPAADLRDVVAEMAARKLGSALVVEGESVVGIFTTIDALRALAGYLAPPAD